MMKAKRPTPGNPEPQQTGPKLRNINDKGVDIIPDEKPAGADKRLKIVAIILLICIAVIGVRGRIATAGLRNQLDEQNKALEVIRAEALLLGITEDDDGDLITPAPEGPQNVQEVTWDSIEERNAALINSFAESLLTWQGNTEYNEQRQYLIDYWKFPENSRLLTTFMPALKDGEILEGAMKLAVDPTIFVLENKGKDEPVKYFVICSVRMNKTPGGTTAKGTVGIHLTINPDGTISDVTAQTLTQKAAEK